MYIESIINDYAEKGDIDVSSFQFLVTMCDEFKTELEFESNDDKSNDDVSDNLPF